MEGHHGLSDPSRSDHPGGTGEGARHELALGGVEEGGPAFPGGVEGGPELGLISDYSEAALGVGVGEGPFGRDLLGRRGRGWGWGWGTPPVAAARTASPASAGRRAAMSRTVPSVASRMVESRSGRSVRQQMI